MSVKMNKKKKVEFTLHAEDKLKRLMKVGVTKERVLETIENPEKVVDGYYGRKIAQGLLSEDLILRIGICLAPFYNHTITQISTRKRILLT